MSDLVKVLGSLKRSQWRRQDGENRSSESGHMSDPTFGKSLLWRNEDKTRSWGVSGFIPGVQGGGGGRRQKTLPKWSLESPATGSQAQQRT